MGFLKGEVSPKVILTPLALSSHHMRWSPRWVPQCEDTKDSVNRLRKGIQTTHKQRVYKRDGDHLNVQHNRTFGCLLM